jgi:hypothetical protein
MYPESRIRRAWNAWWDTFRICTGVFVGLAASAAVLIIVEKAIRAGSINPYVGAPIVMILVSTIAASVATFLVP